MIPTLREGATKVQPIAISDESALADALVTDGKSTAYNYGPCRNRTYNLLVAALHGIRRSVSRSIGRSRKTAAEPDAESTLGGGKGATEVQPPRGLWFWATRGNPWLEEERRARRIRTRQLSVEEKVFLQQMMEASR